MQGISVVIPAYNEHLSVAGVVRDVKEHTGGLGNVDLLVIDDGSSDGTGAAAEEAGARVISHQGNLGYGAALKTGIRAARFDRIVIIDADGTYPAANIPEIVASLETCDMAVGARTGEEVAIPFVRRPAKWLLRRLAQYITGMEVPDFNSGLRAFRRDLVMRYYHLLPEGFSFTTTITLACLCDGLRVEFLPINYRTRVGKSKLTAGSFFSFIGLVLRLSTLFRPLKVYMPVAAGCFSVGLLKLVYDIVVALSLASSAREFAIQEVVSVTSLIFLLAGLQIALVGLLAEAMARRWAPYSPKPFDDLKRDEED
jgi:glycosyltransferase involved in cell wall biosynthesis